MSALRSKERAKHSLLNEDQNQTLELDLAATQYVLDNLPQLLIQHHLNRAEFSREMGIATKTFYDMAKNGYSTKYSFYNVLKIVLYFYDDIPKEIITSKGVAYDQQS